MTCTAETQEVRRSRRLVVSFIATVGNYEYGFYWYFYLDGSIQFEVKLTGIVSTMAVEPGETPAYANVIAPGLAAPHHQHLFNARLDFDVDGTTNTVYEVEARPIPAGPENPFGNAFRQEATLLASEAAAQRQTNAATSRHWRVVNPTSTNRLGNPVGYRLLPTMSTPTLLAQAESSVAQRAGFARHNLWVTPYVRDERRAAGEFPNQHAGGDGLPRWTDADRPITEPRHRVLVQLRRHALRATRGLARHAGGVRGLPAQPVRVLRPQSRPRRPTHARSAVRSTRTGGHLILAHPGPPGLRSRSCRTR